MSDIDELRKKSKEVIQKVHDNALAAGMFTGHKAIKEILDEESTPEEKLAKIEEFVNKTLETLEPKVKPK